MQRLEVSGAVGPIYGSLGVKRLREGYRKVRNNQAHSLYDPLNVVRVIKTEKVRLGVVSCMARWSRI